MTSQVRSLSAIWSALRARCPLPVADCLFRITEGRNVSRVRRGGTDRHGLDRPEGCVEPPWTAVEWRQHGYSGPFRPFVDVIYASTAAEIEASLAGQGTSALSKIPQTAQPHVIVYRADAFSAVHTGQYAFRVPGDRRAAVVAIEAVERLSTVGQSSSSSPRSSRSSSRSSSSS